MTEPTRTGSRTELDHPGDEARPGSKERSDRERVLDHFLATGQLDDTALLRGRRAAGSGATGLFATLVQLGLLTEDALAEGVSHVLGLPQCPRERMPEAPVFEPEILSPRFLSAVKALPLARTEHHVTLALADPTDPFPSRAVAWATGLEVRVEAARGSDIEALLVQHDADDGSGEGEETGDGLEDHEDSDRLKDLASGEPVIRYVNRLLTEAALEGASDIHMEPQGSALRVRLRVDGMLREAEAPPVALVSAVLSRIKLLAHLDIAERRLPQDGRAKFVVRGQTVDLRISTLPTMDQESAVIRILDRSNVSLNLADLGYTPEALTLLMDLLNRPNGIILVTGPTGSGKTTTLYAGLTAINDPARKIITVEDPIEYRLQGINQVQVRPKIGLNFAKVLRSMLRQDPDVLMVGEIRDLETAEIAVQSALTGHLVLSTLHTNSAADTLTRLRDMGVEPYMLGSTILGVVAQRLVRTLCPECRRPKGDGTYEAVGCGACNGRGYRGRRAVYEIMPMSADLREAVNRGAPASDLARIARGEGMRTLQETGEALVAAGETTMAEVLRATREI